MTEPQRLELERLSVGLYDIQTMLTLVINEPGDRIATVGLCDMARRTLDSAQMLLATLGVPVCTLTRTTAKRKSQSDLRGGL